MSAKPLAIDLFAGLGGWAEGFLAEGYDVVGFDIERHDYGNGKYPADLVLQDVTTLHGSQFRDAACIVASPPCQEYSYMAMPWTRAKWLAAWRQAWGPPEYAGLNGLFYTCFRLQREASEAAGHHIPMVVENVVGAQRWVGRAAWHYGSYYLWGDVPALMPDAKVMFTSRGCGMEGTKQKGSGPIWFDTGLTQHSSNSPARKAASAQIAKIPLELASYIARVYK